MKRDLAKLSFETYDLAVIGAGIYGAAVAWDAALRGLKVALIDRGDFGGATSANSLKIIHGGLRYLQQLDILRMRESFRERRLLMHMAPHLVHPLPVLMPTYGHKLKSRPVMAAAMLVNDLVGFDRNRLPDPEKYVPGSHTVSGARLKEWIPGYDKHNLNGGALWYDCQCHNTERLLLSFILSAASKGADVANYASATGFLKSGKTISGVQVQDLLSGDSFAIRARLVVNTAGPWVDEILAALGGRSAKRRFLPSTAMNLVVDRDIASRYALGLSGPYRHAFPDGSAYKGFRILFFAPWRGRTIIGTDHRAWGGQGREYRVTEREIQEFLADVNQAFPAARIRREEVTFFYGGLLPMTGINPRTGEVRLVRHYRLHDHAAEEGIEGLVSVIGVKYTTARNVAERTLDLAVKKLGRALPPCRTGTTRLLGGEIDRFAGFLHEPVGRRPPAVTEKAIRHLCFNYGSALDDILHYGREDPSWLETMPDSDEVLRSEVLHAVREEMALRLADAVLRRTDLGSAGHPGAAALQEAARIMARELNWSESRRQAEIDAVERIYVPA